MRNPIISAMDYDFTTIYERKGKDALALDCIGMDNCFAPDSPDKGFDAIPMWVADMNFATAPSVTEAIVRRCQHPIFGYFTPREEYFSSIIRWQKAHTGLKPEHIGHENGVLGGVITALNVLCQRGDKVLLHSPTYVGFTNALKNNGYDIVHSPLIKDSEGIWRMNLEGMERTITRKKIRTAIFCSPHNPTGRVWSREEIAAMMEVFKRHDVYVVSDEIWSDILLGDSVHTPTQTVSEDARQRTIALYAPTKTFNIAGLVGSYHIIYNDRLREAVLKEASLSHYNEMNVLSMHALIGGYSEEGAEWVRQLRKVLTDNVEFACNYIDTHFQGVEVMKPQGTYMMFPDFSGWCAANHKTISHIKKTCWRVGVAVQDGGMFHGPCNLRFNLALPRTKLEEAFDRIDRYVL